MNPGKPDQKQEYVSILFDWLITFMRVFRGIPELSDVREVDRWWSRMGLDRRTFDDTRMRNTIFFLQSSPFVLVRHSIISWRLQVYRRSAYSKCRYQNIAGPDYNNDNNRKASGESDFFFFIKTGVFPNSTSDGSEAKPVMVSGEHRPSFSFGSAWKSSRNRFYRFLRTLDSQEATTINEYARAYT